MSDFEISATNIYSTRRPARRADPFGDDKAPVTLLRRTGAKTSPRPPSLKDILFGMISYDGTLSSTIPSKTLLRFLLALPGKLIKLEVILNCLIGQRPPSRLP